MWADVCTCAYAYVCVYVRVCARVVDKKLDEPRNHLVEDIKKG